MRLVNIVPSCLSERFAVLSSPKLSYSVAKRRYRLSINWTRTVSSLEAFVAECLRNNSVSDYAALVRKNREDISASMEEWRRRLDELEKCFEQNRKHINASFETWSQRMDDVEKSVQSLAEVRS